MTPIQELIEYYKNLCRSSKAAADRYRANTRIKHCREGLIRETAMLECYAGFIDHLRALDKKSEISSNQPGQQSSDSTLLHIDDVGEGSEQSFCKYPDGKDACGFKAKDHFTCKALRQCKFAE